MAGKDDAQSVYGKDYTVHLRGNPKNILQDKGRAGNISEHGGGDEPLGEGVPHKLPIAKQESERAQCAANPASHTPFLRQGLRKPQQNRDKKDQPGGKQHHEHPLPRCNSQQLPADNRGQDRPQSVDNHQQGEEFG
ncbi:hypothetical protein D3C74_409050 [compost metagenome]